MSDEQYKLIHETAAQNLTAWRNSGVIKALKFLSADDPDVYVRCRALHGAIVSISDAEIGVNLPPLPACSSARCRCYFQPWDISIE